MVEVLRSIADKECQLMEKKWMLAESKWQEANELVGVANVNQLIALEKRNTAGRRLQIVQIQYELVAVKVLCEIERATRMSNIIHRYLVDFNKRIIKIVQHRIITYSTRRKKINI